MTPEETIKAAMRLKPGVITIGEIRGLSRRKARKLAHQYRGSRRGEWYSRWLTGDHSGFYAHNKRLCCLPKTGRSMMITVHSAEAGTAIQKMLAGGASFSIASPLEIRLAD